MAALHWQRAKDVFQDAVTRPREQRPAFLDEACGGDARLRQEVESLLVAHDEAAGFLSRPAFLDSLPRDEASGPAAGTLRIGPYRVLDTIGRGGMGTVYRAVRDDDAFHKTVALKLVRAGRGRTTSSAASDGNGRSWPVSSIPTSPPCSTAARPRTGSPTS